MADLCGEVLLAELVELVWELLLLLLLLLLFTGLDVGVVLLLGVLLEVLVLLLLLLDPVFEPPVLLTGGPTLGTPPELDEGVAGLLLLLEFEPVPAGVGGMSELPEPSGLNLGTGLRR